MKVTISVVCASILVFASVSAVGKPSKKEPAPVQVEQPVQQVVVPPPPVEVLPLKGEFHCMKAFMSAEDYKVATKKAKPTLKTAAWLYIETEPADAYITVEQTGVGTGSGFYESAKSKIVPVVVKAQGYKPFEGFIELTENTVRKVKVKLDVIGGSISVLAEPWGSKVRIDGKLVGTTPITVSGLLDGSHDILIEAQGCNAPVIGMVKIDETFVIGRDACARRVRDMRPAPVPAPVKVPDPVVVEAASVPAPVPVVEKSPAPVPEPAPVQAVVVEPVKAVEQTSVPKSPCEKVCDKFITAVSPESVRSIMKGTCMRRCDGGDREFSICAWQVQTMTDVQNCMKIPAKN